MDIDTKEKKFKPFNLKAAKDGAKVQTRGGLSVRLLCFDGNSSYPIVGLVTDIYADHDEETEGTESWAINGAFYLDGSMSDKDSDMNLVMAVEQRTSYHAYCISKTNGRPYVNTFLSEEIRRTHTSSNPDLDHFFEKEYVV